MRVLLITPIFHPEPSYLRGLPFARELVRRGIDVDVLTGFPNYPQGRLFPGYRQRLCQRETINGVQIMRVPSYISHDSSGWRRAISYLSISASTSVQGPFRGRRPDLVHVFQGIATLCLTADLIHLIRGSPYLLDLSDLWPESVLDSGMFRLPAGAWLLNAWCNHTYRWAKHIVTLSEGVKGKLLERGAPEAKVTVLYNWCDAELEKPLPAREASSDLYGLRDTFNVIYAGTFGPLQALRTVLQAAELVQPRKPRVRFVLIGTGLEEVSLKRLATEKGLQNVIFLPWQPTENLSGILAQADATLVHLKDSPLNRVGIPSKVQHCLAMGKPILIGALGSAPALVEQAQAGIRFDPENAVQLATAVERLEAVPRVEREAMGQRGRDYYLANLSFDIGVTKLIGIYERTLACGGRSIGQRPAISSALQS